MLQVANTEDTRLRLGFAVKTLEIKPPLLAGFHKFFLVLGTLGEKAVAFMARRRQMIHMFEKMAQGRKRAGCNDIQPGNFTILNPDIMNRDRHACFT